MCFIHIIPTQVAKAVDVSKNGLNYSTQPVGNGCCFPYNQSNTNSVIAGKTVRIACFPVMYFLMFC